MRPSVAELPVSDSSAAVTTSTLRTGGEIENAASVAGSVATPAISTLAGKPEATTAVLPNRAPPTLNDSIAAPPSCRSSPSNDWPLAGSTPTSRWLSTRSPATRTLVSVPTAKRSAALPLPPSAASLPRLAPTRRLRPRAEPSTCSSVKAATLTEPAASSRVTSWFSELLKLACQPASVEPADTVLAVPCTCHSPPMAPPTCTAPSASPVMPLPETVRSARRSPATRAARRAATSSVALPVSDTVQLGANSTTLAPGACRRLSSAAPVLTMVSPLPCNCRSAPCRRPNDSVPTAPLNTAAPLRSAVSRLAAFSAPSTCRPVRLTRPSPPLACSQTLVLASVPLSVNR